MKYFIKHAEEFKAFTEEQFFKFLNDNFSNAVKEHANVCAFEEYECVIEKIGRVWSK